jgi:hypothetical protein
VPPAHQPPLWTCCRTCYRTWRRLTRCCSS